MSCKPNRTCLAPMAILLLGLSAANAQTPESRPAHTLKVDVRLVMIPAHVSSPAGDPVTDLKQEDFEVWEKGKLRPIKFFKRSDNMSLQMILLIDTSLSAARELPAEKVSMARFIRRVLRRGDAAALIEMAGDARTVVDFSSDANELETSLKKIDARAGTGLYDTLIEAAEMLGEREGRRVMILITDGNDTTSKEDYHAALAAVTGIDASIFAVVVRPIAGVSGRSVRGENALTSLSAMTGGQAFFPEGPDELDRFFDELSEVLRTQYLIGIAPAPAGRESDYREIVVRVSGEDYFIRHRQGYFTRPSGN